MEEKTVKVLYTTGYGAGWYSWNEKYKECLFDTDIIKAVEEGYSHTAFELATQKWPDGYWGGYINLSISEVPYGSAFRVEEYDGYEKIITSYNDWIIAK